LVPVFAVGLRPDDNFPCASGGYGSPNEASDQGVAGGRGQSDVPGDKIPDDASEQAAEQYFLRDDGGFDESGGDGFGDSGSPEGPDEVGSCGEHDCLPR